MSMLRNPGPNSGKPAPAIWDFFRRFFMPLLITSSDDLIFPMLIFPKEA
jgi:hypothetical protein